MKTQQIQVTSYALPIDIYPGALSRVLVIIHGFGTSTKERQRKLAQGMQSKTGCTVVVPEYSGHGNTDVKIADTCPAQHLLEMIHVYDHVVERFPGSAIDIMGSSYGSYLAAYVSYYRTVANLILRAPAAYDSRKFFTNWSHRLTHEAQHRAAVHRLRTDLSELLRHPPLTLAAGHKGRTLVVAHEHDTLIPRTTSDAYVKAFQADHYLAWGASHSLGESGFTEHQLEAYQQQMADWLLSS